MQPLLWKNLKITVPMALVFTVLGYIFSIPICYIFDYDAARMKFLMLPPLPILINPEQRVELGRFQARVTLGGTVLGIVLAQTIFAIDALKRDE
jgi:ABC-type sulfate transport system permease component